jgi:hypothetical protein
MLFLFFNPKQYCLKKNTPVNSLAYKLTRLTSVLGLDRSGHGNGNIEENP